MSGSFDPYYTWLAIPPDEQPPHHYRLLGVRPLEENLDVIENAADQRMKHLRDYQSGRHGELSQKLLNEVAVARVVLLDSAKKLRYDNELRTKLNAINQAELKKALAEHPLAMAKPPLTATPLDPNPAAAPLPKSAIPIDVSTRNTKPRAANNAVLLIITGVVACLLLAIVGLAALLFGGREGGVADNSPTQDPSNSVAPVVNQSTQEKPPVLAGSAETSSTPSPPLPKQPIPGGLHIISASYGAGGQRLDVTDVVRNAVAADPYALIQPDNRSMGDPAEGQRKDLVVSVEFGDKPYQFTIAEEEHVSLFPVDDNGVETADAAQAFRIVAARYCMGLTPVDITRCVADRVIDPAEPVMWSGLTVEDPWYGVQKRIVVWFDYKNKRYRRLFAEGEFQPLLPNARQVVKPITYPQKVRRELWCHEQPVTCDVGTNDNTFALLAEIAGNFLGGNEQVRISLANNNQWQISGNSSQPLAIRGFGVESSLRDQFQEKVEQFEWSTGKPPVKMIHSSEGFCVLSAVGGALNGLGDEARVYIHPEDNYWYLTGRGASPINASALAYRLKNQASVKLRYAEFHWRQGMPEIKMLQENAGFCSLSSVAGDFSGYGEVATINNNDNGQWVLKCTSGKPIHARAYSIRVVR